MLIMTIICHKKVKKKSKKGDIGSKLQGAGNREQGVGVRE